MEDQRQMRFWTIQPLMESEMTAEEEFEKWWASRSWSVEDWACKGAIGLSYLAATTTTAARCVEICKSVSEMGFSDCATVIKMEFDLE